MKSTFAAAVALPLLVVAGCTSIPTGPSVMALPGTGKSFEQFRGDDMQCRRYASEQIGETDANRAANDAAAKSAVVGTVVGAAAGAAIGGHDAAGVGAGTGLVVGSMAGASSGQYSAYATQRRYDLAYIQCMYATGHKVPVYGSMVQQPKTGQGQPDQPPAYLPPPPGHPPPPPTR
jgi:hypothetical protein